MTPQTADRPGAAKPAWRENLESILWAVGIALLIRTFIVAPFKIPSGSMRPTLIEGDRILVNKFGYRFHPPQRGDIVVFRYPDNPKRPFIKRLIAQGSETVEIREGRILINGRSLESPAFVRDHAYQNQGLYGRAGQLVEVPANSFYVLGDNSGASHDSRFWGFVPKRFMIGKALCIFWPPNRIRVLR